MCVPQHSTRLRKALTRDVELPFDLQPCPRCSRYSAFGTEAGEIQDPENKFDRRTLYAVEVAISDNDNVVFTVDVDICVVVAHSTYSGNSTSPTANLCTL
jgi:hypothetical protein